MIKYITDYRCSTLKYNTDTNKAELFDHLNSRIDWVYNIDEDGEFSMGGITKPVSKGDFVIKFYSSEDISNPFIIIKSDEWLQNLADKKEAALKRAEEFKNNDNICCEDCCCEASC